MKTTKVITGVVTTSLLASSCHFENYNLDENLYEMSPNNDIGVQLCNIEESNLSYEFTKKLKAIKIFVENAISNKDIMETYHDNPNAYFDLIEKDLNTTFSVEEKNVLMAYLDQDIIKAVKEQDIDTFLRLGRERGYLTITLKSNEDLRSLFNSDEEYNNFITSLTNNGDDLVPAIAVIPLAIYAVAITTAAIEIQIGLHLGYVLYTAAATNPTTSGGGGAVTPPVEPISPPVEPISPPITPVISTTSSLSHDSLRYKPAININPVSSGNPVLRIWSDNNGTIAHDAFYREIIEAQVEWIASSILKHFPEYDEETVKNTLTINLEGYYGLRK